MVVLPSLVLLALVDGPPSLAPSQLTVADVVDRMVQADNERVAVFSGYTGMRRYSFDNKTFKKRAEMTVRVTCASTGAKTFEVVTESGSGFVRGRIIGQMIEAERGASEKGEQQQTRIVPRNYDFRLLRTDVLEGRPQYVLEISPKTRNQYMVRGHIWVDAEDFAITRIEGSPAKNPSFWIRSIRVVHRYERIGQFWLPKSNHSRAEARIFGPTEVRIDYFDYVITDAPATTSPVPNMGMGTATAH
jgi:hypothetical protein